MARKIRIGAIAEISTGKRKAYAQFSHYHNTPPKSGGLLRILPGFCQERPIKFGPIVAQEESFYNFFPLQAAVNLGIFEIVSREDVPEHARVFPLFRAGNTNPRTGTV